MEAEARAILTEAVSESSDSVGLFTALLDRFAALGGVDLELPDRTDNGSDFSGTGIEVVDPWAARQA
jgi:plasmid stability protein